VLVEYDLAYEPLRLMKGHVTPHVTKTLTKIISK
jgi:hypothetical protein